MGVARIFGFGADHVVWSPTSIVPSINA